MTVVAFPLFSFSIVFRRVASSSSKRLPSLAHFGQLFELSVYEFSLVHIIPHLLSSPGGASSCAAILFGAFRKGLVMKIHGIDSDT